MELNFHTIPDSKKWLASQTGEKPFHCKICGARFSRNTHPKGHILTHTGEKAFHCEIFRVKFSYNSNLKTHLSLHTGEKCFHCEICGAKFSQNSHVKTLMRNLFIVKSVELNFHGIHISKDTS